MVIIMRIDDINPRKDKHYVLTRISEFLDNCDPDERPDIVLEYPK
jgi:hypothetical protein